MKWRSAQGSPIELKAATGPQPVLQADSDDGAAHVASIALGIYDATADFDRALVDRQVVAIVDVGCGTSRAQFQVDWRDGTTLTIAAHTVTVSAEYIPVMTAGPSPVPNLRATPPQIVQAAIAEGTRASQRGATLTVRYGAVALGAPVSIPIPARAFDVSLMTDTPAGFGGYTLDFLAGPGAATLARWLPVSPTERCTLPSAARQIEVSSARAALDQITLIYGIDV